ncbi:Myb/SANT-like DNA-binding domain protein [Thalictrum thalictroides]|uniref:Myb/SANT-like DNA-binding domain protein n=1 Tax=Thalictrum thalictroides TaxID=46969 RepID=A0A7J6WQM4_THATH|nr:Myb/SANT-like DNA-binding domain protein [Thalictrum thalictroides]
MMIREMGAQAQENSALRTIWTTAMDRFFIDLMLEQVGRGSRVDGHLFSKRAWRHMTVLFNEKFQLQYSRDHLKNRHKTLRRVYRAVKTLLEQTGFTWDETQHMVTADDRVWSNYTKAHPEARSYRTKSIPHFSDMCKIFKYASIGKHIDSAHKKHDYNDAEETQVGGIVGGLHLPTESAAYEETIDDEQELTSHLDRTGGISELDEQQLIMPTTSLLSPNDGMVDIFDEMVNADTTSVNGKQENTPFLTESTIDTLQTIPDAYDASNGSRSRTYWQPPMDSYFIELMLEQVHQGNQFDGTFRKHAWMHMTEVFNAKFGYKYDTVVLKNRYKTLKRQYAAIKILLDQKGFVWDDTRQMVTAEDHIWHDYIKVHPDAKQYITRPVPHFNELSVIYKDVTVYVGCSDPAYNVDPQNETFVVEDGRASNLHQSLQMPCARNDPNHGIQELSSQLGTDIDIFDQNNKRQTAPSSIYPDSKKPRRRNDEGIRVALTDSTCQHMNMVQRSNDEGMANVLHELAAVVSSLSDKRAEVDNSTSTEDAIHSLQAMPDIDDDLILDACDLFEDEKKAKTFLSLDVRLRRKWLLRKLRP